VPLACVVIADLTTVQLAENDMLVDEYEQYPNEKTDVVVVSRSGSDEPEPAPSAADRMFFLSPPWPLPPPRYPERAVSDGYRGVDTTGESWRKICQIRPAHPRCLDLGTVG
jgi:hypothetical protein